MIYVILSALAVVAWGRPSYIAVPADQIAFVDLSRLHVRPPRQTLAPPPRVPEALYQEEYQLQEYPLRNYHANEEMEPIAIRQYAPKTRTLALAPRPPPAPLRAAPEPEDSAGAPSQHHDGAADFGEYVDFGAHTGDHGSFGWYADYPVNRDVGY